MRVSAEGRGCLAYPFVGFRRLSYAFVGFSRRMRASARRVSPVSERRSPARSQHSKTGWLPLAFLGFGWHFRASRVGFSWLRGWLFPSRDWLFLAFSNLVRDGHVRRPRGQRPALGREARPAGCQQMSTAAPGRSKNFAKHQHLSSWPGGVPSARGFPRATAGLRIIGGAFVHPDPQSQRARGDA